MTPTMATIRERLTIGSQDWIAAGETRRAAVAAIFRVVDDEPEILLIKRAEKRGDPWSGQMAFPGGHVDPQDASSQHAAERETREEIGLDLVHHGRLIGALTPEGPAAAGVQIAVEPFVYELESEPPSYALNYEVAEVHWAQIGPMLRHETLSSLDWTVQGQARTMPGYEVHGRIVWGLTYRMLNRLFATIEPGFQPLD